MANSKNFLPSSSRTFGQARHPEKALKGQNERSINPVVYTSEVGEAGAKDGVLDTESELASIR